jgi:hypothetical protein
VKLSGLLHRAERVQREAQRQPGPDRPPMVDLDRATDEQLEALIALLERDGPSDQEAAAAICEQINEQPAPDDVPASEAAEPPEAGGGLAGIGARVRAAHLEQRKRRGAPRVPLDGAL